jgi:hypothetical protein
MQPAHKHTPPRLRTRNHEAGVDKLQTQYVRYKCQPEAQVTSVGWDLATSQRCADQMEPHQAHAFLRQEGLLYNGLAPTAIRLRILEAPAEFAVPVKQDRCARARACACLVAFVCVPGACVPASRHAVAHARRTTANHTRARTRAPAHPRTHLHAQAPDAQLPPAC